MPSVTYANFRVIDDNTTAIVALVDMTERPPALVWLFGLRARTETVKIFRLKYSTLWRHLETGLPLPALHKLDALESAYEALKALNAAKE